MKRKDSVAYLSCQTIDALTILKRLNKFRQTFWCTNLQEVHKIIIFYCTCPQEVYTKIWSRMVTERLQRIRYTQIIHFGVPTFKRMHKWYTILLYFNVLVLQRCTKIWLFSVPERLTRIRYTKIIHFGVPVHQNDNLIIPVLYRYTKTKTCSLTVLEKISRFMLTVKINRGVSVYYILARFEI